MRLLGPVFKLLKTIRIDVASNVENRNRHAAMRA
jgi:hypothetical protein